MRAVAEPAPTATVVAEDMSLDDTDFRFLDPPEPGAHARVAIKVANHASAVVVGKLGTATVTRDELISSFEHDFG